MKEKKYIVQKETQNEKGDKIYLCYFITEGKDGLFGVGIDMYTQTANRRTAKEGKYVDNIFTTKSEAQLFINMISKGCVTPTTLVDIIEDKNFQKIEKNTCICKKSVI